MVRQKERKQSGVFNYFDGEWLRGYMRKAKEK